MEFVVQMIFLLLQQVDNSLDKTHGAQSRKTHNRNHTSGVCS